MSEYSGPVCYVGHDHESEDGRQLQGGWHYSVIESPSGHEMPGEKLVLENGVYRKAKEGDVSHYDNHHVQYVQCVLEDGQESFQVTPEQLAQIKQILGQE